MRGLTFVFVIICLVITFTFPVEAQTSATDSYKVSINDVIEIKVLDHRDLRTLATVASDGSITFPYIGTIHVEGMKLSEIKDEITKKLGEGYIKYPVVSVSLVKSMSRKIFAYGEVNRRGQILFEEDMTVVKALSLAGGISKDGLYGKVKVRRDRKGNRGYKRYKDTEIDLDGLIEGRVKGDMILKPGDVLMVERNKTFFVHGEVARPGEYVLKKDMTVVKAVSVAGGILKSGLYGKIKVRRRQKGKGGYYKDIKIDLKGVIEGRVKGDMLLKPDDVLIVERSKTFFIYGEINRPGEYVLQDNMTVLKALSLAGGFTKWGSSGRIEILRQNKTNTGYEKIKVAIKDAIKGDAAADILLQPGDMVVVSEGIF